MMRDVRNEFDDSRLRDCRTIAQFHKDRQVRSRAAVTIPSPDLRRACVKAFLEACAMQRWDDHRYYHHSRINQSLHLLSAISFVIAYGLLFVDPVAAALLGWLVAMTTRQVGHFFFEPKGYDHVNQARTSTRKRSRSATTCAARSCCWRCGRWSPLALWFDPSLFGLVEPADGCRRLRATRRHASGWRSASGGLLFRTVHLSHQGRADRPGVDDQDPDRPVPRHHAVLAGAAAPAARRADRPDGARAPR